MTVVRLKLGDLVFSNKSKRLAKTGKPTWTYPFYTSSQIQKHFVDEADYHGPALIFWTGGLASVHFCEGPFSTSTDCFVLKTNNPDTDLKFIFRYLFSNIELLESGFKGAGLKHISKDYLSNIEIPLPSIEEQREIVSKLDKISELIELKKEAIEKTEMLTKSVFFEMFGDLVENSFEWNCLKVRDFSSIRLGKMLDQKKQSHLPQYEYLWNADIQWWAINMRNLSKMGISDEERNTFKLENWDILICEWWEVWRCAIWEWEWKDVYYQKALHRLRPDYSIVSSEYIFWAMRTYCERWFFDKYKNSATISHLTWVVLKEIEFPIPPISLQENFSGFYLRQKWFLRNQYESLNALSTLYESTVQGAYNF